MAKWQKTHKTPLQDLDVREEEKVLATITPCQMIDVRLANPGLRADRKQPHSHLRTKEIRISMVCGMRNNEAVAEYLAR